MSHFLVVAGSSDIGIATINRLVSQGHRITMTSRDESKRNLADSLGVQFSRLEASDFQEVQALLERVNHSDEPLAGLVNCAGSILLKPAHLTSEADYHQVIQANLSSAFAVVRAAGKMMTQGGSIVLLSSAAALVGLANHEAIAAAKAGVIGLALSAAATYASQQLRVNVVAPGLVDTKLTHGLIATPALKKISENMHPLNRIGTVEDIASAICFLLHPENSWITGAVLSVDGGLSHLRAKLKA